MLIDNFERDDSISALGTMWRAVSDRVMGGISQAGLQFGNHLGRSCLHLSGEVRLENNGGFLQASLDLAPGDGTLDARAFDGLRLVACGNDETYAVHLRSDDVTRPWQSYRHPFHASTDWQELRLPFRHFVPYRIEKPLDISRLRRIGLVAIGRAFAADLRVAELALY